MATIDEQLELIHNTVINLNNVAEDSYIFAKQQLDELTGAAITLPLSVISTTIGSDAGTSWTATFTAPATPVEPDYTGEIDEPTLGTITIPTAASDIDSRPTWSVDLTGTPTAFTEYTLTDITDLGTLPEIVATSPTLDVGILTVDPLDDFTEPTYVVRLDTDVKNAISGVLGGSLGLPTSYWDAVWTRAANNIAKLQVGKLRKNRNAGAATWWSLPSESVLSQSREIQDETTRSLQLDKLEKSVQEAVFAREDFWKAVEQGLKYESMWIDLHNNTAQRALAAAQQLYGVRVSVHNANVSWYNALLETYKADGSISDLKVQRVLKEHQQKIEGNRIEIDQAGYLLNSYKTQWDAYQVDKSTQINAFAEQIKFWNGQADANIRYQTLQQQQDKLNLDLMEAQISKINGIAQATLGMLQARTGLAKYLLEAQTTEHSWEKDYNEVLLKIADLNQAAQEAKAKIDVAQAQWTDGQAIQLKTNIAQLAWGYAQAAVAASDVSLGRNLDFGVNYSYNTDLTQ